MFEPIDLTIEDYKTRVTVEDKRATITTHPRIHMFSIDLSETTLTGGMGISVPTMPITIHVEEAPEDHINSTVAKSKIKDVLDALRLFKNTDTHWKVSVTTSLRSHIGLGSETQIVGAVLMAISTLCGLELRLDEITQLGVGQVTGVGTALLYKPGFIIELGYETSYETLANSYKHPTIQGLLARPKGSLIRITAPSEWGIILAIPKVDQSLSDEFESDFWSNILPTSSETSHKIGYQVLMEVIPSLILKDFRKFIEALSKITAQGTKPNETAMQKTETRQLLSLLQSQYGFASISSLGPSLYSFTEHSVSNQELIDIESSYPAHTLIYFPLTESFLE